MDNPSQPGGGGTGGAGGAQRAGDQGALHARFGAGQAESDPQPSSSSFASVNPFGPFHASSEPFGSSPLTTPIYDSSSSLRGPWAPEVSAPAPASSTSAASAGSGARGASSSPLRAVPSSSARPLALGTDPAQSPSAAAASRLACLSLSSSEDDAASLSEDDEMRRSRASPGSGSGGHRSERQVPPRRMQEHQQRQMARQQSQQAQQQQQQMAAAATAVGYGAAVGSGMGGVGGIGAGGQDPYGRPAAQAGYGMPTVYGQQPAPLPYNPRGYSPSYPGPMQVMLGGVPGVPVQVGAVGGVGGQYAAYGNTGYAAAPPELMTSPVAFGNPPPFSFHRISPDPAPSYPPPLRQSQGHGHRPAYPPSSFHFSSPPPSSPPPPGGRPLPQQQHGYPAALAAYPPSLSSSTSSMQSLPSMPSMQGYSPVFGVPTSPVFTQRFPVAGQAFPQPYGTQSPEDAVRQSQAAAAAAGAGTWYFVPDQGQQQSFSEAHQQHQAQQQQQHAQQQQQAAAVAQYGQAYGLGFGHREGDTFAHLSGVGLGGQPLSPVMYPLSSSTMGQHPFRQSHGRPGSGSSQGHGHRPSFGGPVAGGAGPPPSAFSSEGGATERDGRRGSIGSAAGGGADTSFGSQVSQIPFPSLSSPSSQQTATASRPQRRPSSPTRKPFHPNPPANRSEWVMWVGNVPHDATHDELWRYFNQPVPVPVQPYGSPLSGEAQDDQSGGVSSVFLISRSNCAFVNFNSELHLERAVQYFNNKPIRPLDPRCPRLVCRVRRRDDDLRAGVGGQRGVGVHTRWVKEQREREQEESGQTPGPSGSGSGVTAVPGTTGERKPAEVPSQPQVDGDQPPDTPTRQKTLGHSGSSGSFTSTNSSFLQKYFPKRYFILKSLTQFDLNLSVERGVWATQAHNEPVLDQAFRTSTDVYLIFGANKSGEFYGYAKMAGPIQYPGKTEKTENRISWASRTESSHSSQKSIEGPISKRQGQPEMIAEDEEGENREEKRQGEADATIVEEPAAAEECEGALIEQPQPILATEPQPETPSFEVSAPEGEESKASSGGSLAERRDDVPGPMELPRPLLDPPASGGSLAASPQPMTPDESKSLEELEGDRRRPVHHPHIRGVPGRQSPIPTPPVPTGDDVPRPPVPTDIASAPAEIGPERKRFSFDATGPHNTIDGSEVSHSSSLAAVLASQPEESELKLEGTSAAEKQAERGTSSQSEEIDNDGVKRRDTAPTETEKQEHAHAPASAEDEKQVDDPVPQEDGPPSFPTNSTLVASAEDGPRSPIDIQSPEAGGSKPTGKEEESWGTPFKIEWIKVEPLPFYRTRHLRNPWNNDREVKVSRDGTEIEPTVGARLLQEWDRLQEEPTPAPAATGRNRGSRPPFRTGYSTPSVQAAAMQSPPLLGAPYISPPRDSSGNVPQWLFQGRGQAPWQP